MATSTASTTDRTQAYGVDDPRWIAFYAAHPQGAGIDDSDRDPQTYIEQNS